MEILELIRRNLTQLWRRSLWLRSLSLVTAFTLGALLIVLPVRSQPVVLTFLMNAPEMPPFRPIIREFEQKNPGIRINMVEGPNASNLIEDLNK